jgi:hypothetical protein
MHGANQSCDRRRFVIAGYDYRYFMAVRLNVRHLEFSETWMEPQETTICDQNSIHRALLAVSTMYRLLYCLQSITASVNKRPKCRICVKYGSSPFHRTPKYSRISFCHSTTKLEMAKPSIVDSFLTTSNIRGGSSAGRALRSQCRGRGFDPLPLHQSRKWPEILAIFYAKRSAPPERVAHALAGHCLIHSNGYSWSGSARRRRIPLVALLE